MKQDKNLNPNNLAEGDTILVEEAWEDESGCYHDEEARIIQILDDGHIVLEFLNVNKELQEFLGYAEFFAKDFVSS